MKTLTHKGYRLTLEEEHGRLDIWLKEPTTGRALVLDVSLLYGKQVWSNENAPFEEACSLIDTVPIDVLQKLAVGQQHLRDSLKEIISTNTEILDKSQSNSKYLRDLYLR